MGGQLGALSNEELEEMGMDIDSDDEEGSEGGVWDYQSFPRNRQRSDSVPADIYDNVEVVHPRRSYFGARNYETVKDCEWRERKTDSRQLSRCTL